MVVGEGKHKCINYYQDNLSFDEFSNLYKFAFVRNPYARLLSLYKYMKKNSEDVEVRKLFANSTFHQWVNLIYKKYENGEEYYDYTYSIIQRDYISYNNDDHFSTDFVGKFENLEEDFTKVCVINDLTQKFSKPINSNKKSSDDYRVHYSNETQKICEKMFEADLNLFNYDF